MTNEAVLQVVVDPSEARRGAAEVERALGSMANSAESFLSRMNAGFSSMVSFIDRATSSMRSFIGIMATGYAIKSMLERMIDVNLVYNSFIATMTMVKGSAQAAHAEFQYLTAYSDKMGMSIEETSKVYGKLAAALKEFDKSGASTRHIFESIGQAQVVLHSKGYETNGIFLAMEQIISKGKVSLEELQKQLGNRLPDAMGITARAMGVTQAELRTSITKGSIDPLELVLKLANQIKIEYGESARSTADMFNAQVMRMKNAVFNLYLAVGQSGAMDGLSKVVQSLTAMLQDPNTGKAFGDALNNMFSGIAEWISTIKAEDITDIFDSIGVVIKTTMGFFKDLSLAFSSTSESGKTDMLDMADGMSTIFLVLMDMVTTFTAAMLSVPLAVNAMVYDVRYIAKKSRVFDKIGDPNYDRDLKQLETERNQAIKLSEASDAILLGTEESPVAKAFKAKTAMFAKLKAERLKTSTSGFSDAGFDAKQALGRPLTDSEIADLAKDGPGAPSKAGSKRDVFNAESTNLTKLASKALMEYNNLLDNKVKSENLNLTAVNAKIATDKNFIALSDAQKDKLRELAGLADKAQLKEKAAESFSTTRLEMNKLLYSSEQSLTDVIEHRDTLASKNQSTLSEKLKFDSAFIAMNDKMKNSLMEQAVAADALAVALRNAQTVEQSRYATAVSTAQTGRDLNSMGAGLGKNPFNAADKAKDSFMLGGPNQFADETTRSHVMADAVIQDANNMKMALADIFDPSKAENFGNVLQSAFGPVGAAIDELVNSFENLRVKNLEMSKERMWANKAYADDSKGLANALAQIESKESRNRLDSYASMASAAKGFFKENSTGYKMMEGLEKGLRVLQMANMMEKLATSLFVSTASATGVVAGQAVETGAVVAGQATQNAAKVPGVFMSFMSAMGPWGAAAAAVAIAAVLGGSFSGGGSTDTSFTAEAVQKKQGTGSVFGDSTAKSESITKSIELLASNSDISLPITSEMLVSLRNIDASMSGLSNIVLRTAGMTDSSNMNASIPGNKVNAPFGDNSGQLLNGIFGAVGDRLSQKITGFLFGSSSSSLTDGGLQIGGSVNSLQNGQGINQYANIHTSSSGPFGGIFGGGSETNSVQTKAVSGELSQQFGLIFKNLQSTLQLAATGLGKNAADVGRQVGAFVVNTSKISLQGLKGADLQAAINSVISTAMDNISQSVFPNLERFRKVGEGYTQTVIRVANGVEQASVALERLGIKAVSVNQILDTQADIGGSIVRSSILKMETFYNGAMTGVGQIIRVMSGSVDDVASMYTKLLELRELMKATSMSGASLNSDMINGAGGVSNLKSSLSDYLGNFFSPQEQSVSEMAGLADQFAKLGLSLPSTKAAFRALVEGIDVSTSWGSKLKGSVLALSGAFAQGIDKASALKNKLTETLTLKSTDVITSTITKLNAFTESMINFKNSLLTGNLSTLTPGQKYAESKNKFESTLARAKTGDAVAQGQLQSDANAFLTISRSLNASSQNYTDDFNKVANSADLMLDWASAQLKVAQNSLTELNAINANITALNAAANATPPVAQAQSDSVVLELRNLKIANDKAVAELKALREEQAAQAVIAVATNIQAQQDAANEVKKAVILGPTYPRYNPRAMIP
jgi:tape measure domain-containing protein